MAGTVLNDVKVTIGGVDFANKASSVTINGDVELLDTTGFGDSARTYAAGFKNWSGSVTFMDDFTDNGLNETIFSWWGTSQAIAIVKADTTTAATNPSWTGYVLFPSLPFLNAAVGQVAGGSINFQGIGTLTRNVS
jgi:hypothetical protein